MSALWPDCDARIIEVGHAVAATPVERVMQASTSDFINLPAFAKAVADYLRESLVSRVGSRRVLTLDEAAEYCGLSRESFKKKVVRDRVRKVRFDKCWRFDIADLDEWIDSHKEEIVKEMAA